mgnify:CR=1 FL=1
MRIWLCAVIAGAGIVWSDPAGYTRVQVTREYAVRVVICGEITQIDGQEGVISSNMPAPPYVWEFKYDRTLVEFVRASDGVTTTYREIPNSPYAVLTCETANAESRVFWRALRITDGQIAVPVQAATAAGAALTVTNPDRLEIVARPATLRVLIEAIDP